jgi:sigma-B regulation protein RsbU (phosphoserine phosphatase)
MEQDQFKVSFSVGTKLLISVVSLLLLAIAFLDVSTILLLTEDKRAYTYQAQSTEAVLAGREVVNTVKHALDTLRLSLASIDPSKPVSSQQQQALKSVLENQTEVLGVRLRWLDPQTGRTTAPITEFFKDDELSDVEAKPAELSVAPELVTEALPVLEKNSYSLANASTQSGVPVLGVILADLKTRSPKGEIPIAIGFVSLKGFGRETRASHLTVVNRDGWVLFDSDPTVLFARKNIGDDPLFQEGAGAAMVSGAKEYEFEGARYLASYVKPGLDLVVLTKTDWRDAMSSTYALIEKYVLLGCMAVGAAILFAILFAKTMTAPLKKLYEATREVAKGNFEVSLDATSGDEIGALTGSFVAMSRQISVLIQEQMKKVHLENELAIASTVQQTLLPEPSFQNEFVQIHSHYRSASECGGDWWGFFSVGKKMCIMIADATGHGLPSALITASARSCFSVMHKLAQEHGEFNFAPGGMLSYANRVVHDAASGKIMMTFFAGVIDFETGELTYASAGHNPPWLLKKDGQTHRLNSLVSIGQRLGEAKDVPAFEEKKIQVAPGDVLFLYTDGLMEGKNTDGEMYGKKRTRKVVEAHVGAGPEALISELMKDFLAHNGEKPLDDDVTLAAARILSVPAQEAGGVS